MDEFHQRSWRETEAIREQAQRAFETLMNCLVRLQTSGHQAVIEDYPGGHFGPYRLNIMYYPAGIKED